MRKYLALLFIIYITIYEANSQQIDCPAGWMSSRNNPRWPCYLITNKIQRTWTEAQTFCEQMGGGLWKIDSVDEKNWIYNLLKVYHGYYPSHIEWWLGLHDNPTQTGLIWVDKSTPNMQLLQWVPGEPTTYDHSKACVQYYNGSLRHEDCQQGKYFICERARSNAVFCDARNQWESINKMCYKVVTKLRTWDDARAECQKESGDLVVVEDLTTEKLVGNFIESRKADMWIGLRAYQSGGTYSFKWQSATGKDLNALQSFWAAKYPLFSTVVDTVASTNGSASCVMASHSLPSPKVWEAAECRLRAFSLCQKPQGRCASGWISNGYLCYQVVTWYKTSWSSASAFCQQQGARLIAIKSNSTQQFVNGLLPNFKTRGLNAIWMGLSDKNQDGNQWYWSSGYSLYSNSFTNYNGQTPVNRPGVNDCFNIFTDDKTGTWQIASDCANNNTFICEISRGASPKLPPTLTPPTTAVTGPTTSPAPVTWSTDCGPFWVNDPRTQYCYKFSDDALNWFQAESMCKSMGAHLASINDYHEERFIADRLYGFNSAALWIGINSLNSQEGYHWVDGTGFGYFNWAPGEPNNVGDYEHCGEIIRGGPNRAKWNDARCDSRKGYVCRRVRAGEPNNYDGNEKCGEIIPRGTNRDKWNDVNCKGQRGYICKKRSKAFHTAPPPRTPSIPAGKIYGCPNSAWKPYKRNCYMFMTTRTNWMNAGKFCQTQNGQLASILDENEQNFVFSQLPVSTGYTDQFFIGLNDLDVQMKFQWTDRMAVTYTNWAVNEPNNWQNRPEDCVTIFLRDGTWNDGTCEDPKQGFICKTNKAIFPSNTPQSKPSMGCTAGAVGFGYNCFQLMTAKSTWQGAKANCIARGGNLAVIKNSYQQAFLASQIAGTSGFYWIGVSHNGQNGALQTATGDSVGYTAWSSNHTGNDNTSCVASRSAGPGVGLWMDMPCTARVKYICETQRSGFSTAFVPTTTTIAPLVCPKNWNEFNGYCYKTFNGNEDKKNYFEAQSTCLAMGADLVSIHSNEEHSYVFSYRQIGYYPTGSYWIGLNDFDQEKGFKWTDGTAVNYTKWNTGEPNDAAGTDDCVEYNSWSRKWNDNTCYISQGFICKVKKGAQIHMTKATPPPTDAPECGASPDWKLYNGSCYYVNMPKSGPDSRKTWFEARDYCIQQGGDLPSLHSVQENGFLSTIVSRTVTSDCWIGLKDQGVNQFGWTDGTPLDFIHWSGGEPNDAYGSEKCAQIKSSNGYWNDNNCNLKYHFICKRPQGIFAPTAAAPTTPIQGGCPSGFTSVSYGNKCYKIYGGRDQSARVNYTAATGACRGLGAGYDIASVTNHEEQATLINMVNGASRDNAGIWIGMNDLNRNQRFTWQDSSRLQYTNWDKNEPQRSGGHCVEMYTDVRRAGKWHNIDCSDNRPYMCQVRKDATAPTVIPPPGCTLPGYQENSIDCYRLYTSAMSWRDAREACHKDGTHLTSVVTVYEQAYIDTLSASLNSPVWIGLADVNATGTYTWRDGNRVVYTSWGQNEPTFTTGGSGRCVMSYNGLWNDSDCSNNFPFICKKPFFNPPPMTPNPGGYCSDITWKQFKNFCFFVNLSPTFSYSQAEKDCTSRGMNLASITSKLEENFILQTIDNDPAKSVNIWTGFRKKGGFFSWADGAPVSYVNWKTGPSGNDCVMMRHIDGFWQDSSCSSQKGYVCKTTKLPATSPPSTTTTISTSTTTTTTPTTTPASIKVQVSSSASPLSSKSVINPSSKSPTNIQSISPGRSQTTLKPGALPTVIIATPANPQALKQKSSGDLSGGQVAGIVVGVLLVLVIACVVLMVAKRRGGGQLFSFVRLRGGDTGFENAAYDKGMDSVQINGTSGNKLKNGQNGQNGHMSNGNSVGFTDFEEFDS